MEIAIKLRVLADAAKYDASCASSGSKRAGNGKGVGNSDGTGICHSYTPDGRCVSLLKILLTNYCIYDCKYCVNRVTSDTPRARFTVDEVVNLTLDFYKRNYIEGLFLSSGIIRSVDHTMEELVEVARKLREEHHFGGYIHLKAVPGASAELLERAGRYADRLSANIELPRDADLRLLAPEKRAADVDSTMTTIRSHIDAAREDAKPQASSASAIRYAPSGQSTQMIVGATDASDRDMLATATRLYDSFKLRGSTSRRSLRSRTATAGCPRSRRRSYASTASTRPTG
jgi:putative DNA modification/repair radical SAM protein